MNFGQQAIKNFVFSASSDTRPAITNNESTRNISVWDNVNRVVLTLHAQLFSASQDHLGRIDLAWSQGIGVNESDINFSDVTSYLTGHLWAYYLSLALVKRVHRRLCCRRCGHIG
jgi:hypothetical protein